jgi:hypothetical protein
MENINNLNVKNPVFQGNINNNNIFNLSPISAFTPHINNNDIK